MIVYGRKFLPFTWENDMSHEPSALDIARARVRELEGEITRLQGKLERAQGKITELENRQQELTREVRVWRWQAEHDLLTELLRDEMFAGKVANILRGRRMGEVPGSCLAFIDVDRFKAINDEHGHSTGNFVLKEIAKVIREMIREDDLACRVGDEYLIFFNHAALEDAERIVSEIQRRVSTLRFGENGQGLTSISYGVALRTREHSTFDELYRAADTAMYEMKKRHHAAS